MSAIENILGMLPDRVSSGKQDQIFTPPHIAKEMVNALPEDIWNRHTTFFDPICKSGIFLYEIYGKLMESEGLIKAFPDKQSRSEHILKNQLFGIAVDQLCQLMTIRTIYGNVGLDNNIILLRNYTDVMRNIDNRFLLDTLQKEFGIMKFDIVIGNPPYSKGMDLDFVDLGYKLSSNITAMITPAKWQTAEAEQAIISKNTNYGKFREQYVPHMKHICFYPDCIDIFCIGQADGITWYIMDKNIYENCTIENKCIKQTYFNSTQSRNIRNRASLHNIGDEIVKYLGEYEKFKFMTDTCDKKYQVWTNSQVTVSSGPEAGRYLLSKGEGNFQVISLSRIVDTSKGEKPTTGASQLTFASDDRKECENFISWLNCKFTRFFVAINISKLTGILTDDCFRFVPAPPSGKFDHIYTDEELYKAFNLPQKYIDVIEAIIKERK